MFGHDDQSQHHDVANQPAPAGDDSGLTQDDQALADAATTTDTAGEYIDSDTPTVTTPTPGAPVAATDGVATVAPSATPATVTSAADSDSLLGIKQQALQQLTPLVGHLEQSAEEKFRTTMMMIQASDNPSLIKTAYDAALQITDEKIRAQALLDIVNEINYFTHNNNDGSAGV
ncbi:MAG TPA: hypothetical protein VFT16_05300 [Candidatus Saccharimonadales bacterium]|nr:hypothetical protein [Candidatus Saccharimonadales bacterium]